MSDAVFQVVTDRVLALLKQGTVPWHKPWHGGEQMPRNLVSRKAYRGVNVFLLHAMAYESQYWVTYKQAQGLGGNVRKGEKACPVVFWKWLDTDKLDPKTGKPEQVPMLRYYSAFNVAQCEGVAQHVPAVPGGNGNAHKPIPEAEAIVAKMPKRPDIRHGQGRAFYSPSADFVGMPDKGAFESAETYFDTLFHELSHATGHPSRLGRKGVSGEDGEWSSFGSKPYAREELVAEMGAAYLCGHVGIVERTIDQSAAYIASWLQRLSDDHKLVVNAAAQAQKAADFILATFTPDGAQAPSTTEGER